jgi:hypothetical protein
LFSNFEVDRRTFLNRIALTTAAWSLPASSGLRTQHLILIVNSGARKKDYYENPLLAPNVRRIASEAFVFEEDHCEQVYSHETAFAELTGGSPYPIVDSLHRVPSCMARHRPKILICRDRAQESGHYSFEAYLQAVRAADDGVGSIFDWVKTHPEFSRNTAIVIRPEFGRDDQVNDRGALHHSYGFYSTHRVARILWGPDFHAGVDKRTIVSSLDMAPMIDGILKGK